MAASEPTVRSLERRVCQRTPIFHPHLRRTRDVIRRPEWMKRGAEAVARRGSIGALALFGIMFTNCYAGGYGFEDTIGSAGPLVNLIVCGIIPWIWCLPTGLAVAELATSVPSNSGVLMWVNAAYPPFISFMCVITTIMITFVGNATYPNLTAEYVENLTSLDKGGVAGVKIGVIVLCCILNVSGVEIVGVACVLLCIITTAPFMIFTFKEIFTNGLNGPTISHVLPTIDWPAFLSVISWNYANIENAGSVVEEVANPRRNVMLAMIPLMLASYVVYVLPMLAGTSAMGPNQDWSKWVAGYWPDVAAEIAGEWLRYVLFAGSIVSGLGLTLTSMCCTSRVLAGMGTMQMFPKKISRFIEYYDYRVGTPIPAIVINSIVTLIFSVSMDFGEVVALCQSLYCLRLVLIYVTVIKLRINYPNLPRPYALPCNTWIAAMCLVPAAVFSLVCAIFSAMVSLAIGMALIGFLVGGLLFSFLYCRFFAPNGFQGVVVDCEVTEDDEDQAAPEPDADQALNEDVFNKDGHDDRLGEKLFRILPLNTEEDTEGGTHGPRECTKRPPTKSVVVLDGESADVDADEMNHVHGELASRSERFCYSTPSFGRSRDVEQAGIHRFLTRDADTTDSVRAFVS